MNKIDRQTFPDEAPTAPRPDVTSRTLIRASRIDALVERALERLLDASDDAIDAAVSDLHEVRAILARTL